MDEESKLVNKKYGKMLQPHLLEQYKLYVETAEKVPEKRHAMNNFYLTLSSSLFVIDSYLSTALRDVWIILLSFIGIIVSFIWIKHISAFQQLNSEKYRIILELEEYLPARIFKKEWVNLENSKYKKLTVVESYLPKIFIFLHAIIILFYIGMLEYALKVVSFL